MRYGSITNPPVRRKYYPEETWQRRAQSKQKIHWGLIGWDYPVAEQYIWDRREKEWQQRSLAGKAMCYLQVIWEPIRMWLTVHDELQRANDLIVLQDRQIKNLIAKYVEDV